jgi:hypothetical protein
MEEDQRVGDDGEHAGSKRGRDLAGRRKRTGADLAARRTVVLARDCAPPMTRGARARAVHTVKVAFTEHLQRANLGRIAVRSYARETRFKRKKARLSPGLSSSVVARVRLEVDVDRRTTVQRLADTPSPVLTAG